MSRRQKYWVDDNDDSAGNPNGAVEQVIPEDMLRAETSPVVEESTPVEAATDSPLPPEASLPATPSLETMSDEELAKEMAKRRIRKLDQQIAEAEAVVKSLRSQREVLVSNPVGALIEGHTYATVVKVTGNTKVVGTGGTKVLNARGCSCGNPEGCYKCL